MPFTLLQQVVMFVIHAEGSTFSDEVYCWILAVSAICFRFIYVFLQVEKKKTTAKRCLEILRIHCQNSTVIRTNRIRKVGQGVDIFDKRILDFYKIHLGQILVHGTDILMLSWCLHIESDSIERINVFLTGSDT